MAFTFKISETLNLRVDVDPATNMPVIEAEAKFIRFRIVIDDMRQAEVLENLLHSLREEDAKKVMKDFEAVKRPKFYVDKSKGK